MDLSIPGIQIFKLSVMGQKEMVTANIDVVDGMIVPVRVTFLRIEDRPRIKVQPEPPIEYRRKGEMPYAMQQ